MKADKKKIIIFAVLGIALLGVGAWQFMGGKSDPPATPRQARKTTPDNAVASTTPTPETAVSPDISLAGLSRKDPFVPGKLKDEPPTGPITKPTPPVTSNPAPTATRRGPRLPGSGYYGQTLPTAPVTGPPTGTGQPTGSQPAPSGYQLIGIVEGPHPVAVFRSPSGMQTMVKLYGDLGEGRRITGIKDGKVTMRHSNGNTTTIQVGGNSQ